MTAAKRALLYLTRKKGRSILLILIIFIMSSFIMVGLALKMSAGKEIERIRRNLGSSFVIGIPVENELYYEPAPEPLPSSCKIYVGPKVTQNAIENILNIEGVTGYFSEYAGIPIYTNLDLRPGLYAEDGAFSEKELKILQHTTHIYRMTDGDLYPAFRTGALEMIDGRNIKLEDHHTIIISEYFAEKNHLFVGDTIELRISYTSTKLEFSLKGGPINLKVVGIFRTNIEQESSGFTLESQYMDNFMFSDFDTGKKVALLYQKAFYEDLGAELSAEEEAAYDLSFGNITFFVDDPQKLDGIMQEIKESDYFERGLLLLRDDTSYQASLAPLKTISVLAMILLAVGSVGCMVILVLLLTMWIKSRKREIGILISIGISKGKIMLQMLIECLTLSLVGVILTIILSGTTINGCCKIAAQLTTPPENQVNYAVEFDSALEPHFNKISADVVQLEYDYSARDAILLIIAVCGISSGSVLAASRQIMKMEPQSLFQTL